METSLPTMIAKKRDGGELTDADIKTFITKIVSQDIHESQIGAMLMAIYLNGLSRRETKVLTSEMVNTGARLTWPAEWDGLLVDKHSTGGVGDKVSLILAPALAACGLKVPMISGRGLGHTGGTLDKLESIPGFRVKLTPEEMLQELTTIGCFMGGQTSNVCPADRVIYSIRDVTATVPQIGLITASILSKKAAESINTLVLDVKTGTGAFMAEREQAVRLAKSLVECSQDLGVKTTALMTDMNSPLGSMVGNALEVVESILILQDKGPKDVTDLTVDLGGHILSTNGTAPNVQDGCRRVRDVISNGQALGKFLELLKAQGVEPKLAENLCDSAKDPRDFLPKAAHTKELTCPASGYVHRIDAMTVAVTAHKLGGGRNHPGENVNWAVGLELLAEIGDKVTQGQPWVRMHYDDEKTVDELSTQLQEALEINEQSIAKKGRVLQVIT